MISFFQKKNKFHNPLHTDIHSHLLAGLDDGVKTQKEAIELVSYFHKLGYQKLITTPHINSDYYRNEPEPIRRVLAELNDALQAESMAVVVEAAAEYYLDEELMKKVDSKENLLTFGQSYLLFETNFLTEPYQLNDFIFKVITQGYKPILAHPERYAYMTLAKAEDLKNRGVLFQINIPSLVGLYSKPIQQLAYKLIDQGWVDLLGSDCHHATHLQVLEDAVQNKYFRKAVELPLLNNSL
ncbi:MAG: capsular biosynthesis protein [Cyclobacteriaceae bacterium]|nr:capsular biosynthesis protein [Cyclobacteriaceae bacterium]